MLVIERLLAIKALQPLGRTYFTILLQKSFDFIPKHIYFMLKFSDFLTEGKEEKTKSFWELTKPFLKEGMDHGARLMEEKLQEMGYEFSGHKTFMSFSEGGYGFGIGVHFSSGENKYFLVDNFSEGVFRLYADDGRKAYTESKPGKGYTKPKLLSQSHILEDVLKDVISINKGRIVLEIYFSIEDLDTEDVAERTSKVDVTDVYGSNLKEYCDNFHKLLKNSLTDPEEVYHAVTYYKDKPYRIMGSLSRGYDVMNDKDMDLTDKEMMRIS